MTVYKTKISEICLKNVKGEIHKVKITSSKDLAKYFREIFNQETLEVFEQVMVIFMNNSNNTIAWYKASQGGITGTIIDIRLVMKAALNCYATSMAIAHNHPSGTLTPSDADKAITNKLREAGNVLDIKLLDHIIITSDDFFSFTDNGLL